MTTDEAVLSIMKNQTEIYKRMTQMTNQIGMLFSRIEMLTNQIGTLKNNKITLDISPFERN